MKTNIFKNANGYEYEILASIKEYSLLKDLSKNEYLICYSLKETNDNLFYWINDYYFENNIKAALEVFVEKINGIIKDDIIYVWKKDNDKLLVSSIYEVDDEYIVNHLEKNILEDEYISTKNIDKIMFDNLDDTLSYREENIEDMIKLMFSILD